MPLIKLWKKIISSKKIKVKRRVKKTKKKLATKTAKKSKKKVTKKTAKKTAKSLKRPVKPAKKLKKSKKEEVGTVTHYFGKISVGIIKLKKPLKVGDKIHIKGAHDDFTQGIKSMQHDHKDIALAKKGLEVGIKVSKPVHENDKVYKL